jgi:hypothetical protein
MKWLLSLLGLSYLISPYDLFPDLFVGVGWIDDLIILGLLWWYLYVYRKRRYSYESPSSGPRGGPYAQDAERDKADTRNASGPKDPYTVLGLSRGASAQEIREAYRRLASQYHPDKVIHLGHEFRELAEIRFKEIQAAYQELKFK